MEQSAVNTPVQEVKIKGGGTTILKVVGILMIVLGAIGMIGAFITSAAAGLGSALIGALDSSPEMAPIKAAFDTLTTSNLLALLAGALTLITGILAVVFSRKINKGTPVIVFAVLTIVVMLIGTFMSVSAANTLLNAAKSIEGFKYEGAAFGLGNIFGLLSSLVLPVLAIVGVMKNKRPQYSR